MLKKLFSVRGALTIFLIFTTICAVWATYYKISVWGFSFKPTEKSDVWTVDAHISFEPTGEPIEISLSTPSISKAYKILSEDTVAKGYEVQKDEPNHRIIMKSKPRKTKQNVYYRIMLYDNAEGAGKIWEKAPQKPKKPRFEDDQQEGMINEIWALA